MESGEIMDVGLEKQGIYNILLKRSNGKDLNLIFGLIQAMIYIPSTINTDHVLWHLQLIADV